ncbi:MAG: ribosome biogenesis GTP-binding protein YihA/YsxC [Chlamydiota bacterium]
MKGRFVKSALLKEDFPSWHLPEIAFVGRSNVGKSSLINHLLQERLAKTSDTPGKTQLLNFFNIDEKLVFVDLPGYGFAKVPGMVKRDWSAALVTYLSERKNLRLILLLLDIRRLPTPDDQAFFEWAVFHQKPLSLVFTKCDKISLAERQTQTEIYLKTFKNTPYNHYTIKEKNTRLILLNYITKQSE